MGIPSPAGLVLPLLKFNKPMKHYCYQQTFISECNKNKVLKQEIKIEVQDKLGVEHEPVVTVIVGNESTNSHINSNANSF